MSILFLNSAHTLFVSHFYCYTKDKDVRLLDAVSRQINNYLTAVAIHHMVR